MDVGTLREELFATLKGLRDKENPLEIDRANAIVQVANAITATAKVEVEHMKVTGARNATGFIPTPALPAPGLAGAPAPRAPIQALPGGAISKGK